MPEYLAPGVYLEETSFRSKSIEGVSTSTTGFVGMARRGPVEGRPPLLTSFADFVRIYGSAKDLGTGTNYLALAVKQYFDNGGSRLYVHRVYKKTNNSTPGIATAVVGGSDNKEISVSARYPGSGGNGSIQFTEVEVPLAGGNYDSLPLGSVIKTTATKVAVRTATGWVDNTGADVASPPNTSALYTLTVDVVDADGNAQRFEDLGYHPSHKRFVGAVLAANPSRRADQLQNMFALQIGSEAEWFDVRDNLKGKSVTIGNSEDDTLGTDGVSATTAEVDAALTTLATIDDISIIAAPGLSQDSAIRNALVTHADRRDLYRVAVLDTPGDSTVDSVPAFRGAIDSDNVAMYFPWITIPNPEWDPSNAASMQEVEVPPSGAVAGIYARNDVERGVWKTPANEVVLGALRFSEDISFAEQETLNPMGINCLRFFHGRGYRVWGGRTASSDPEYKYLSVRRYMNYLKASIERGTQWAVFEPNGEALWANVTDTIDSFLYNEWRQGALLGGSAKEAYFVRCDRSTMTQNDLDNGRMVCQIGVAIVKPAEFVIFRIGQKTTGARD